MTLLALVAALSVGAATPAPSPEPSPEPVAASARIAYGDLNLATASGARTLETRIDRGARRTCAVVTGRSIAGRSDCQAAFREEALDRLPTSARQDYARGQATRVEL